MRALVTGSAGFVGRHMVTELQRRGWNVDGWDTATGRNALALFDDPFWPRPELLVHCAAHEPFRAAIDSKPELMVSNLMLDAAMFRWVMRSSSRELNSMQIIYLSSSAAYPMHLQRKSSCTPLLEDMIRADHIERSDADYGWVKITGEHLAENARQLGAKVAVVRPFSGYGRDQSTNHPFMALLDRACRRDDPFIIWGDGQQVRDWIHIDDVIAGALAVADSGTEEPVNLCTGIGTSMVDLARMACERVGYEPEFEFRVDKPAGVAYRVGDPTRLHQYYKPQVTLAEGVERALSGGR